LEAYQVLLEAYYPVEAYQVLLEAFQMFPSKEAYCRY
jgi:hypothetical protein